MGHGVSAKDASAPKRPGAAGRRGVKVSRGRSLDEREEALKEREVEVRRRGGWLIDEIISLTNGTRSRTIASD